MIPEYIDHLLSGDIRSIVALCVVLFLLYTAHKTFKGYIRALWGLLRVLYPFGILFLIYVFIVYPEETIAHFQIVVDFITELVKMLLSVLKDQDPQDQAYEPSGVPSYGPT